MTQQHRWEASDIIDMAIIVAFSIVSTSIIGIIGVLLFLGKELPVVALTMFGSLLTGVMGIMGGYLGARRKSMPALPSPQVNMGDGSTTNVAPGLPPPDPAAFPNPGGPS